MPILNLLEEITMNELKENRYIVKANSYMIDLNKVDFITWKENEREEGTYWAKLHIGTKEVRYVCKNIDSLRDLLTDWSHLNGKEAKLKNEDIIKW